jgi:hypothetical protein
MPMRDMILVTDVSSLLEPWLQIHCTSYRQLDNKNK